MCAVPTGGDEAYEPDFLVRIDNGPLDESPVCILLQQPFDKLSKIELMKYIGDRWPNDKRGVLDIRVLYRSSPPFIVVPEFVKCDVLTWLLGNGFGCVAALNVDSRQCLGCGSTFTEEMRFVNEWETWSGREPIVCKSCQKRFPRRKFLKSWHPLLFRAWRK